MNPLTAVAKHGKLGQGFSKPEMAQALEHPGRNTKAQGHQSPAEWVTQLIDQKKCILLCGFCRAKFNYVRHHYRKMYIADPSGKTDGYQANGNCDSCKQFTANCGGGTNFIHEEHYRLFCQDPLDARRKARAAAKSLTAWQTIQLRR
jgi:hypothetical protein